VDNFHWEQRAAARVACFPYACFLGQ